MLSEFPEIGDDVTPTTEMVVKGKIGNGISAAHGDGDYAIELMKTMQAQKQEHRAELRKAREASYEEGVKDSLEVIAHLEGGLVDIGNVVMMKLVAGEKVTANEMTLLKLAQKTAEDMKNRALGKSKSISETTVKNTTLNLIAGKILHESD